MGGHRRREKGTREGEGDGTVSVKGESDVGGERASR